MAIKERGKTGHSMSVHRLTPVQRRVLAFMLSAPEPVVFSTGHKSTDFDGVVVRCQTTVQYFLRHHGYIHKPNELSSRWELTEKGTLAARKLPAFTIEGRRR